MNELNCTQVVLVSNLSLSLSLSHHVFMCFAPHVFLLHLSWVQITVKLHIESKIDIYV